MQTENDEIHPVDRHVGHRLRLMRVQRGVSQTTLADGLGITFQQIQKYEKGTNRVSASRLHDIAKLLAVPIVAFFDGLPDQEQPARKKRGRPAKSKTVSLSKAAIELAIGYDRVPDGSLKKHIRGCVFAAADPTDQQPTA